MKRFLLFMCLLLAIALPASAQNLTTTSATVVDSAGTAYTFGTYTATLVNNTGQPALFGGNANFQKTYQGGLDTNGFFSLVLPSVSVMTPGGMQWSFYICANPQVIAYLFPKPAIPCFTYTSTGTQISGALVDLSASLSAASAVIPKTVATNGNNAFSGNNTHSGAETFTKLNNIIFVDGTTYALTDVGVNAAIAASAALGGGKVLITKPITATANINLASKVHVECADWEAAPITWAGGAGPNAIFVGGAISDGSIRYCHLKGPNLAATPAPVLTTSTSGGSLGAATTIFVQTTYVNASGETIKSTESVITTGAGSTNSVTVQAPWITSNDSTPPVPATGYTVYSSVTTGTEKQQTASGACVNITTSCVIQVIGAGANAPTSTTAAVNIDLRGIEIDGLSRYQVEYNKISGMSYCIFETSGGSTMQINHNYVQSCTLQGIVTYDADMSVDGNRIDTVGTSALHHGIYVSGGQNQTILNNTISNVYGFCIQGFASVAPQINAEIRIIGNSCEAGGQASSSARGGIIVGFGGTSTAGSEYVVQGNTISNLNSGSGIQVGDGRNIIISGNILRNWGAGDGININSSLAAGIQGLSITGNILDTNTNSAGSGNGIVCSPGVGGVKNVTISGNQLSSIAFHGIKINACLDGAITGNQIFNFNLQNSSANGVDLESGATGWTIGHNRARSTAATGFAVGINTGAVDNIVSGDIDLNAAGTFYDNGTRTIVFGEKVNASDKHFQLNSPGACLVENGATSGTPSLCPSVTGGVFTMNTGVTASTAGTGDIGSAALPFGNLWLGTAATNNFKFQPATAAAARTIVVPDFGVSSATMTFKEFAQTFTTTQTFAAGSGNPDIKVNNAMVAGNAPTCSSTGSTSPTCTVTTGSTNTAGTIQITVGTSPAALGTVTLTFSGNFGTNPPVCIMQPSQLAVGQWNARATIFDKTPAIGSDLQNWDNNGTVLTASTAIDINYHCWAK